MDVIWCEGSAFGLGSPRISWSEVMEMDYQLFISVRAKIIELKNAEVKRLPKPRSR